MENADFLQKFNELTPIEISDTYTMHCIDEANQIETFLNSFNLDTLTELESLELKILADEWVAKMDAECPYIGQRVTVTGEVMAARYELVTDTLSIKNIHYTNHSVISNGYHILVKTYEDGDRRYVAGHHFLDGTTEPVAVGPALAESIGRLYSFAPVGSVDIASDVPENRHGGALHKSVPEIVENINYEIGQADDEADALCRLRNVVVKDAVTIPDSTIDNLMKYTYECLNLDTDVPYRADIRGAVYKGELSENGGLGFELFDNEAPSILVSPIELRLAQYPKRVKGGFEMGATDHFMIKLKILGDAIDAPERTIFAPVRNIKSLRSLRRADATAPSKWYRA